MADKKEEKTKAGKKTGEKLRSMHDEVVKDFLSENETAKSFFKEYLPAGIVRNLDFNTLQICKDTFINKKLARYFSDQAKQERRNLAGNYPHCDLSRSPGMERGYSVYFIV